MVSASTAQPWSPSRVLGPSARPRERVVARHAIEDDAIAVPVCLEVAGGAAVPPDDPTVHRDRSVLSEERDRDAAHGRGRGLDGEREPAPW